MNSTLFTLSTEILRKSSSQRLSTTKVGFRWQQWTQHWCCSLTHWDLWPLRTQNEHPTLQSEWATIWIVHFSKLSSRCCIQEPTASAAVKPDWKHQTKNEVSRHITLVRTSGFFFPPPTETASFLLHYFSDFEKNKSKNPSSVRVLLTVVWILWADAACVASHTARGVGGANLTTFFVSTIIPIGMTEPEDAFGNVHRFLGVHEQ